VGCAGERVTEATDDLLAGAASRPAPAVAQLLFNGFLTDWVRTLTTAARKERHLGGVRTECRSVRELSGNGASWSHPDFSRVADQRTASQHESEPGSHASRRTASREIKRILVPTDFSACSAPALRQAQALARQWGAAITLLYVVDLNIHTPLTGPTNAEKLRAELWKEGQGRLGQLVLEMVGEQADVQTMIAEGLPSEEIAEAARGFDLIVIGKRKPKPFWHLFSRRTLDGVLKCAPCPVMVVSDLSYE
jgi:nucleotide-binding universal stress UspA family protein